MNGYISYIVFSVTFLYNTGYSYDIHMISYHTYLFCWSMLEHLLPFLRRGLRVHHRPALRLRRSGRAAAGAARRHADLRSGADGLGEQVRCAGRWAPGDPRSWVPEVGFHPERCWWLMSKSVHGWWYPGYPPEFGWENRGKAMESPILGE